MLSEFSVVLTSSHALGKITAAYQDVLFLTARQTRYLKTTWQQGCARCCNGDQPIEEYTRYREGPAPAQDTSSYSFSLLGLQFEAVLQDNAPYS
ncbi:hypothetical protein DUNSADRAFT_15997 [Dunaliella salina]|uniref:Encoded protein n=1 Tax=Dunaliella salina TaxID=3046 RepID=A0ABQ7G4G2_DUNSA|nr:hypothetical protein DUNSADRAFT_15997 [Dunaliella salina]|eukprot:KAF5829488.1 hypothetical protein DUNSADRAFT_15997 [Dunaliella salina]